jgi:phenylpropionate dioxygenase-like ring-hydroxylating dioxygenase large terminal subunit
MTAKVTRPGPQEVRPDYVPVEAYISRDWLELEREKLWPKVWQWVCREEEIPNAGDFVTYDILDDSISIVRRQDGSIGAYFNACPHRGRRLTEGCGRQGRFHCKFHGWQFDLHGKPVEIVDRDDWASAPLQDREVALTPVQVARWGGWVFINMDPEAESLEEFLAPAKAMLDPFEFERMRYVWRKQIRLPCNWKTALEAFDEGYHVQTTHRQLLGYHDDVTYSKAYGKHGMFGFAPTALFGLPAPRIGDQTGDLRKGLRDFNQNIWDTLKATTTAEMLAAGDRLMELPEDAPIMDVYVAFATYHREETAKRGISWPAVTPEQQMASGTDWHIFPNMVFLHQPTNLLGYRARPDGDDPNRCIFEVYSLERFPDGVEPPKVEVEAADSWRDVDWGLILEQDFQNMEEVQRGMRVRSFTAARTNPVKERAISNFHETLHHYINEKN